MRETPLSETRNWRAGWSDAVSLMRAVADDAVRLARLLQAMQIRSRHLVPRCFETDSFQPPSCAGRSRGLVRLSARSSQPARESPGVPLVRRRAQDLESEGGIPTSAPHPGDYGVVAVKTAGKSSRSAAISIRKRS